MQRLSIYILYLYLYLYIYVHRNTKNTCIHTHTCVFASKYRNRQVSNLGVWYSHQEGWAFCSCGGFWNPLLRPSMVAFVAWPWRSSVLATRRCPQNQKQWRDSAGSTAGRSKKDALAFSRKGKISKLTFIWVWWNFFSDTTFAHRFISLSATSPVRRGGAPQPNPGKSFGIWWFKPPCAGVDVKCVENGWQWWEQGHKGIFVNL